MRIRLIVGALALVALFGGWQTLTRHIARDAVARAEVARQDSIARAAQARADAWQRTAVELSGVAARLAEQVQRDSARVAQLLARAPRVDTLWRTDSTGRAVPLPVVAKEVYDSLGAACSRLAGDCSQALAAKDRALAARDSATAALLARVRADSLARVAAGACRTPGFWSRFGVMATYGVQLGRGGEITHGPQAGVGFKVWP